MTGLPIARSRWARAGLGLAWILALAVVIVGLRALGHGDLSTPPTTSLDRFRAWLDQRDTPTAAFAILRLTALVVASYLLGVTVLGLGARIARVPRFVRLVDAATLPFARRLLRTVAGLSLSASSVTFVALPLLPAAQARPPTASLVTSRAHDTSRGSTVFESKPVPPPHDDGTATMRVLEEPSAPPPAPPPASPRPTWSVTPGDSLWSIAEGVLSEAWRRPPTDAEMVPYWQALIEHNRSRLADTTNADLIYPGQTFELPTPPPRP